MNFLKDQISKMKGNAFGKSSWVKRADVIQKEQEILERDHEKYINRKRKHDEIEQGMPSQTLKHSSIDSLATAKEELKNVSEANEVDSSSDHKRQKVNDLNDQEESKNDEDKVPQEEEKSFTNEEMIEIRNKLRSMMQPIKLFGESNFETFKRLQIIEELGPDALVKNKPTPSPEDCEYMTKFQRDLKEKLAQKPYIDIEIGKQKPEELIESRVCKF